MKYDDVNFTIITRSVWGLKADPTEYDYDSRTIRIREDYRANMLKTEPLTHHWVVHELAHHMQLKSLGIDYIRGATTAYPNNRVERYAFAYQFYYLMENRVCNTLQELFDKDRFFHQKKIYAKHLEYYWNNANFIINEMKEKIV